MADTPTQATKLWRVGATPILHDGKTYQPETAIPLDDDTAEDLARYLDGLADEATIKKKGTKK